MIPHYDPATTALLCIDFYNDFLSEGGKLHPWIKEQAEELDLLANLRAIVASARTAGITVVHVPHHRWEPHDHDGWQHMSPYQQGAMQNQIFAKGTWGGSFHDDFPVQPGDVQVTEHWGSSGFANTDLEHQLRRRGIQHIICIGLIANTCLEATGRFGMELGFHVTLVRDATAARTAEALHAALDINGPTYAHQILTTAELLQAIPPRS